LNIGHIFIFSYQISAYLVSAFNFNFMFICYFILAFLLWLSSYSQAQFFFICVSFYFSYLLLFNLTPPNFIWINNLLFSLKRCVDLAQMQNSHLGSLMGHNKKRGCRNDLKIWLTCTFKMVLWCFSMWPFSRRTGWTSHMVAQDTKYSVDLKLISCTWENCILLFCPFSGDSPLLFCEF
jgi:hypothetical protein